MSAIFMKLVNLSFIFGQLEIKDNLQKFTIGYKQ